MNPNCIVTSPNTTLNPKSQVLAMSTSLEKKVSAEEMGSHQTAGFATFPGKES
jgi:hypothetical protein